MTSRHVVIVVSYRCFLLLFSNAILGGHQTERNVFRSESDLKVDIQKLEIPSTKTRGPKLGQNDNNLVINDVLHVYAFLCGVCAARMLIVDVFWYDVLVAFIVYREHLTEHCFRMDSLSAFALCDET